MDVRFSGNLLSPDFMFFFFKRLKEFFVWHSRWRFHRRNLMNNAVNRVLFRSILHLYWK